MVFHVWRLTQKCKRDATILNSSQNKSIGGAKHIFTPDFSGSAHQQGNYGASSHSCCERVSRPPFNCPPELLTSSGMSQFNSNQKMLDNCLRWSSGISQIRSVTLVSIRTAITADMLVCCSKKSLALSSILIPYMHFVVFWLLSSTGFTFNIDVEKELSIIFSSGGNFCQTERCCCSY